MFVTLIAHAARDYDERVNKLKKKTMKLQLMNEHASICRSRF